MKGCVMAMDGWVMKTRCPNAKEVTNQVCFRNRKGVWGMVIFAGCDSRCSFLMFSVKCPGSTNDCIAWEITKVFQSIVVRKLLPPQYYFICDEAVSANEFVLSPYGGRNIGVWRDSFNYHLSSMRQSIERAFGLLTRRWGIFWRPLSCDYGHWNIIAQVCAKLHNVCIDFGLEEIVSTMPEDYAEGDSAEVFMNEYHSSYHRLHSSLDNT
jgi:DDE superfamily endonuclease